MGQLQFTAQNLRQWKLVEAGTDKTWVTNLNLLNWVIKQCYALRN